MQFIPVLKDGYLFYDELKTYGDEDKGHGSTHMKQWRDEVISQLETDYSAISPKASTNILDISNLLFKQAQAEREREIAILTKYYGVDFSTLNTNEILGPQFNEIIIQTLSTMHTSISGIQRITKIVNDKSNDRGAGHLSFDKYFLTTYNNSMRARLSSKKAQAELETMINLSGKGEIIDRERLATFLYEHARLSILKAWDYVTSFKENEDEDPVYKELASYMDLLKKGRTANVLADRMLESLGLNDLVKAYETSLQKSIKNAKGNSKKELTPQQALIKSATGSNSGKFAELVGGLMTKTFASLPNAKVISSSVGGGHMAGADLAHIVYNASINIDVDEIRKVFEEISGSNKTEIRQSAAAVDERLRSLGLTDYAVLYESTKSYVFGKHQKSQGFAGTSFAFDSMADLLDELGVFQNPDDTYTALSALMNTAKGAYLEDRTTFSENMRTKIAGQFQNAMFDDPQTILSQVRSTGNVIHIFRLTEFIVPLSYFLLLASRALNHAYQELTSDTASISMQVKLPSGEDFKYRNGQHPEISGSRNRWGDQSNIARSKTSFTYHFGKEFVNLLNGELGDWVSKIGY